MGGWSKETRERRRRFRDSYYYYSKHRSADTKFVAPKAKIIEVWKEKTLLDGYPYLTNFPGVCFRHSNSRWMTFQKAALDSLFLHWIKARTDRRSGV